MTKSRCIPSRLVIKAFNGKPGDDRNDGKRVVSSPEVLDIPQNQGDDRKDEPNSGI